MMTRALDIFRRRRRLADALPEFKRLRLRPDELLVVTMPEGVPTNDSERIGRLVEGKLRASGLGNHVLVAVGDIAFSTIGLADCP